MKVEHLKRLPKLLVSIILVLAFCAPAYADTNTRSYFKAYGGDVMTGGWFGDSGCIGSAYQDPGYTGSGTADNRVGGILTFAKQNSGNSAGGASSQYGAFPLGLIEGDSSGNGYGFYSDGALAGSTAGSVAKNLLTFANNTSSGWGGVFEGSVRQNSCIPDYYAKMPSTATTKVTNDRLADYANTSNQYSVNVASSGTYALTAGSGSESAVSINPGTHTTIFVNGNVYIGSNITYNMAGVTATALTDNVPKFALIVKGSIYIAPNVTQLDGFYVAQPSTNTVASVAADDGNIWTCHPNTSGTVSYTYFAQNCYGNRLVINGAVAAKQVNFWRTTGDLGSASTNEDKTTGSNCGAAVLAGTAATDPSCANVGEIINYTPTMIVGGGFFTTTGAGGTTGSLPIDSLLSLPPSF